MSAAVKPSLRQQRAYELLLLTLVNLNLNLRKQLLKAHAVIMNVTGLNQLYILQLMTKYAVMFIVSVSSATASAESIVEFGFSS